MATTIDTPAPAGFFEALEEHAFSPGWAKREPQMWGKPRPKYRPMVWRYADALAALSKSVDFVSTEFAERRNLILVNPVPGNIYPTCRHLVAAYQLVMPGETARSHRHSPNALRLVMDASPGIYTLVDGVRVDMAPGDVVLTPQWMWHGHANYSDQPAFWIDFLDVPLVQNLENMYFEHHEDTLQAVESSDPESPLRFHGAALAENVRAQGDVAFGQAQMPTIGLHAICLAAGERQDPVARIDNNIYAVTAGEITVEVAPLGTVTMTRGDVVVVPSWHPFSLAGGAGGGQVLRVTDEPVFTKLGFRDVGLER
ncbi:cupin domain-containing protein [Sphingomonas sp. TF3]|uniref:cupin domain-containing protein n=1 Tax=Sphingomonas sp. TF3 TaxID=2495580 RepID=UPI000F85F7E1|nr:cupin domain-containing protein [Sphingomonas sp. TF3]RUN76520.1 cupin domain-containing protein [Sphingomonas sp. TF3]